MDIVGYIRVSSVDQKTNRQLDGIKLDRVFTDKISGRSMNRPALMELLGYVREKDIVIVHSMDRLARNLDDLRKLVKQLNDKGVKVKFIKENLEFSNNKTPLSDLMLSVMGAFAEFERSLIKERQMEGIALAKKKGAYKGRAPALTRDQIIKLQKQVALGCNKSKLIREIGICRATFYKYLKIVV